MKNKYNKKYLLLCTILASTFGVFATDAPAYGNINDSIENKDSHFSSVNKLKKDSSPENYNTTKNNSKKNKSKKTSNYTGGASTLPTLNTLKYETEEYLDSPVMHTLTPGTGTNSDVSLIINGQSYYYTPGIGENYEFLHRIASYGNMAVVTTTDPAKAMYLYNDVMYTYDTNKLPLSSYNEIPSSVSDYNYATYTVDVYGNQNINYFDLSLNLAQPKENGVTWEKIDDASGYTWSDSNVPASDLIYSATEDGATGVVRFTLPYKGTESQTQYYKFTYNAPANYDKITSRVTSVTLPGISDTYFYRVNRNGDDNGIALYINTSGSVIEADFIGTTTNSVNQGNGTVYVNSNTNKIEGNFIGNSVKQGGALEIKANVKEVIGNFIGNTAKGTNVKNNGGAINAWNGKKIDSVYGTFIGNTSASGGAINNGGSQPFTINILTGDFIANYAKNGNGGAIYNANAESFINAISGDYIANRAYSTSTAGSGGAIYNIGIINDVTGDFIDNSASNTGGAIYNSKQMKYIVGDYIGNTAGQEGGAIYNYNNATIEEITADFIHNTAGTKGGAIYNIGKIKLIAETSDVTFYDNSDSTGYNDIYQEGIKDADGNYSGTILTLNAAENRIMAFNGSIDGQKSGMGYSPIIKINYGETNGTYLGGIYEFNNTVSGNDIELYNNAYVKLGKITQLDGTDTFGKLNLTDYNFTNDTLGGTLDSINDNIDSHILGNVTLNSVLNAKIDINLDTNSSDTFTITGGSSDYAFNINKINFSANNYYDFLNQEKIIQVLNRQNGNNIELTVDDSIKTTETLGTRIDRYLDIDSLSKNWNEKFNDVEDTLVLKGLIDTVKSGAVGDKNDSIKYKITEIIESSTVVPSLRDTISVLNQAEGERYFTAATSGTTYVTTEDLGETGAGSLTISGLENSVFNIGLDTGFELKNDTTLNLSNITIKGASPFVNVLNSDAVINLNNITAKSDIAGSVLFDLNTSGTNTFNAGISNANITNTGTLVLSNDATTNITNSNIFNVGSSELAVEKNNAFISTNLINNSSNSVLNLQTQAIETQNFNSITLNDDMKFNIDVDLANELTDKITATTVTPNAHSILINSVYIMTDGSATTTAVTLTEDKTNFEHVFDLSDSIQIQTAPGVKSYSIDYSDFGSILGYDENKGILIFEKLNINTLADAVREHASIKGYSLISGDEEVEKNLGPLWGKSLSVNGENNEIHGNNWQGVTVGTDETTGLPQTITFNNVTEFSGFSTPAITNNEEGTVNINNVAFTGNATADIDNSGVLNLKGTNSFETIIDSSINGTTNVKTGTSTVSTGIAQHNINILSGATLVNNGTASAILDNSGTLTNAGTFTANTGSTNTSTIDGTGTLNLNGAFTNSADITQGTLNFTNGSTFTAADSSSLTLNNISNDSNGGLFDTNNSSYSNYSLGKANLGSALNLAIDMSIANSTADTFTLSSGDAGSGTFNISALDISAAEINDFRSRTEDGFITQKILNNANSNTILTLDSAVTNIYNATIPLQIVEGDDTFTGTSINWDDIYGHYTFNRTRTAEMTVIGSSEGLADTIKWAIDVSDGPKSYTSTLDNLKLINEASGTPRTFNFSAENNVFTSTVDAGTTSAGTLTIAGVKNGDNYSTIDANGHRLFDITQSDANVVIQNTKIMNAGANGGSAALGSVANIGSGNSLTIEDSYISDSSSLAISNNGTLTINNVIFDSNRGTVANGIGKAIKNNKKITNITGTFKNNTNASGVIANVGSNAVIDYIEADFINNTGGTHGGAIYNTDGATITLINNSNFTNNKATNTGGALRNYNNTNYVKFTNSNFTQNSAGFGGAIHNGRGSEGIATKNPTTIIENSVFTKNYSTRALQQWTGAGAVYNYGYMEITDSQFNQNATKSLGGAIYFNSEVGPSFAQGLTIDGNLSELAGGGIYGGNYALVDSTVQNNITLTEYGAGIGDTGLDVEKSDYNTDKVVRDINLYAKDGNVLFTNNRSNAVLSNPAFDSGNNLQDYTVVSGDYNDVYSVGKLYLNANEDQNITFNGSVVLADIGETGSGELHINKDTTIVTNTDSSLIKGGQYNFNNTVTAPVMNLYNGATVNLGSYAQADDTTSYGILNLDNITNDANGGTISTLNSAYNDHVLGTAALSSTLNIAIDMSIANSTADTFTLTPSDAGTGTFNISGLDISAAEINDFRGRTEDGYITQKILNNANANTILTLDSAVTDIYNAAIADETVTGTDSFSGNTINWDDTYGHYTLTRSRNAEMTVIGSSDGLADTIKWAIDVTDGAKSYDAQLDNLKLINTATGATRTFNFSAADNVYTSLDDAGTSSAGKLTVAGVKSSDNYSTIDADGHNLFNMTTSGSIVEIDNTKIINATSVANVASGNQLILDNSFIDSSNTAGITNNGTLTLNNSNIINSTITGSGDTEIKSGKTTFNSAVTQNIVTVTSGELENNALLTADITNIGTLTSNASNLADNDNSINNTGTLNLTGGTNNNAITGIGTTKFSGTVLNSAAVSQSNISNSGTLTSDADNLTSVNGIVNTGDLILTGGSTQSNISGVAGTTHIQGNVNILNAITQNALSLDSSGKANMGIQNLDKFIANGGDLNLKQLTGTESYNLGDVILSNDIGMAIDLDLTGSTSIKSADNIIANSVSGSNKIYINNLNITIPSTGDAAPTYAKVSDNNLKSFIDLGDNTRAHVDSLIQDGYTITYTTDKSDGGYLKFAISDLVTAARDNRVDSRLYIMANDEIIANQLPSGQTSINDSSNPFGGTSLSVTGNNKSIIGAGSTGGFVLASSQTLSLNDVKEVKGFSTAIDNSGTVNITDVTFDSNTVDINNNGTLNLNGTNAFNSGITGAGNTDIQSGKTTFNADVSQNTVTVTSGELENNAILTADITNNGTLTSNASNLVDSDNSIANSGTLTFTGGSNANAITGTGTTNISGTVVNNASITQNVLNNTGNLTNNNNISGKVDNSGNITNNNNISGDVDNKSTGVITTSISGLTGTNINNDGTIKYTDSGSTIRDITGSGRVELHALDGGTSILNNSLGNNTLALYNGGLSFGTTTSVAGFEANGGTINTIDGTNSTYNLGNVTINGTTNLMMDFDLSSETSDKFIASSITNNGGSFNISSLKVSGMTTKDHIKLHLGDLTTLGQANVTSDSFSLPEIKTPIRMIKGSVSGGYLTYEPAGDGYSSFNPAIMASSVTALVSGFQNQIQTLHQGFFHLNRYMKYSHEDRFIAENVNRHADLASTIIFNQNIAPEVSKAMWTQPYTTFETVKLDGGVNVDNIAYGMMYGGDSDMFNLKHGFKGVISAFVGYNGNQMNYDGVSMQQNGGFLGVTSSFYKDNFFTALTLSSGASTGDAHTMYGQDEISLLTAGIANKTGYNFEFKNGKIILQPSVFVGYTFVNTFDYTNAAGVRINQDALNAIQIAPGLKLIGNTKTGWQPYASVDVAMNVFPGNNKVKANDVTLPKLSEKTYIQYGAGIQKSWKDKYTAFLETMVRNGGRTGIVLQGGFRWTIGKDYSNVPSKAKYIQPKQTNTDLQLQKNKSNITKNKNKYNILTKLTDDYQYIIEIHKQNV